MKHLVREIAARILPARYWVSIQSWRGRNHQVRWLREQGVLDLARRFQQSHGSTVLHGPFAGMKYPLESILSRNSIPMLLGSYELELHQIIVAALAVNYRFIVDIGSAEGYYAVGFAFKGKSPVITFDTDGRELRLCQEMARLNNVADRVTTRGWCSPQLLRDLITGTRSFVLSDCEGYETELFCQQTVDALRRSDVLIEIHGDAYAPLLERFSKTHRVDTLVATRRSADEYPELKCLAEDSARAVDEYRQPQQRWLYASSLEAVA